MTGPGAGRRVSRTRSSSRPSRCWLRHAGRAFDAAVPFSWVTADEAYGQVKYLRVWLEQRDVSYVLATRCNDDVLTTARAPAAPTN